MTGEITTRGRASFGWSKEKIMAAYRAGVTQAIIPDERKDLKDVPDVILKQLVISS